MAEELKPCPFCGGEAKYHESYYCGTDTEDGYVECTQCLATSAEDCKETTIKLWNTRK